MLKLLATLALLVSAAAVHDKGILRLADRRLVAGDTLRVSGEKFSKRASLVMLLVGASGRTRLAEIRTDSAGLFRITPAVPADLPAGAYRLIVVAADGDEVGALDVEIVLATQRAHPAGHGNGSAEPSAVPLSLERARNPWVTGAAALGIVLAFIGGALLLRPSAKKTIISGLVVLGFVSVATGGVAVRRSAEGAQTDSAAVVTVVERYHRALADGDTVAALALLATDAIILESGDVETRDEYRSRHLAADIVFARAVPSTRGTVRVTIQSDVAWAISTSRTQGTYRGRAIDSQGAELMVVTREQAAWKIRAVHWSSHAARPSR